MIYEAKASFTGYKLGFRTPDIYIAIPNKYWKGGIVTAKFQGEVHSFSDKDIKYKQKNLPDKWKAGATYELWYVRWKKAVKPDEVEEIFTRTEEEQEDMEMRETEDNQQKMFQDYEESEYRRASGDRSSIAHHMIR